MPGRAWSRTSTSRKVAVSWTNRNGCANLAKINRGPNSWCSRTNGLRSSALVHACGYTGCLEERTIAGHAACFLARIPALTSSHAAMTRARDCTAHGVIQKAGFGKRKADYAAAERETKSSSACRWPCKLHSGPAGLRAGDASLLCCPSRCAAFADEAAGLREDLEAKLA